ncbi:UNVERIFIED_CONTAM: hypothetical protein GTU68_024185 [Idotea baltica]|nr:hypothetical protein [Idotea baltica]
MESYNQSTLTKLGVTFKSIQDNQAKSGYGVLRGLHYQIGNMAQAKLVRVLQGAILDVAVDIRPNSLTYGQHLSVMLSAENKKQLFVPKGFAHGYLSLSDETIVFYKCDQYYSPANEGGIRFNDPTINVDWDIDLNKCLISEKDKRLPYFGHHRPLSHGS